MKVNRALYAAALMVTGLAAVSLEAGDREALEREFKAACAAMAGETVPGTNGDVLGKEGWVLLTGELRFAAVGRFFGPEAVKAYTRTKPEYADPIPAIVDFKEQLAARGTQLVFMPVPLRPVIYPESVLGKDKLAGFRKPPLLFREQHEFFEALRDRGVRVVDLNRVFLEHRDDERAPIFVPSESHWTGFGVVLAAAEVAKAVRKDRWLRELARREMTAEWKVSERAGHIYRDIHEKGGLPERPPDRSWCRAVKLRTGEAPKTIGLSNPDSPVVVMGDSNVIWWKELDASLAHQLAYELGVPVDVQATVGGGATNTRLNLIRTSHANPGYLESKRLVVWCYSSRATIEGSEGWRKTPIDQPPPRADQK